MPKILNKPNNAAINSRLFFVEMSPINADELGKNMALLIANIITPKTSDIELNKYNKIKPITESR